MKMFCDTDVVCDLSDDHNVVYLDELIEISQSCKEDASLRRSEPEIPPRMVCHS